MKAALALRRSASAATGPLPFAAAAVAGGIAVAGAVQLTSSSPKLGLGLIVGLAVAIASIQRLDFGLLVLVALTYAHGFTVIKDYGGVPSAAFPFAVLIVVFAFFAREWDQPFLPPSAEPAVAAFAAYGAWLVATAGWAADPEATLRAAGAYWKLMLVVVAVLALVRTPRLVVLVLWAMVAAAAVLAGMTVVQHFSSGLTFFGFAKAPIHELTSTGEAIRAVGPIGNPNAYAQLLVVALPLAVGRLLCERLLALRLFAIATVALCTSAIYLTDSRGGFVGAAVVLVLCFFRYRPRLATLVLGATVILLLVGSVSGSYGSRLGTITQVLPWHSESKRGDPSIQGRAAFLRVGLRMWLDNPFGGVGYENYGVRYPEYNRRVGTDPTLGHSAHNTPLEVLSETGVIGLALWLILILAALTSLWQARSWAGNRRPDVQTTADFLAISLVGYLVTSLFLGGTYAMISWLLLAICFSVRGALGPGIRPLRQRFRVSLSAR